MRRTLVVAVGLLLMTAAPATAQTADPPTLDCSGMGLKIMAAEVSGARFVCHISGAQPGDTTFAVRAERPALDGDTPPIVVDQFCTGTLSGGIGTCTAGFVDRASGGLGPV